VTKSLFCVPLVGLCSFFCLFLTGCGGGGNPLPPPATVTGLVHNRPHDNPGEVQLTWSPGSVRATRGYLVERMLQGEATFSRLTPAPITSAAYTDRLPAGLEQVTPFYRVVAVDKRSRLGTPSAPLQAFISAPGAPFPNEP
jgi:hypothetical protein